MSNYRTDFLARNATRRIKRRKIGDPTLYILRQTLDAGTFPVAEGSHDEIAHALATMPESRLRMGTFDVVTVDMAARAARFYAVMYDSEGNMR